MLLSLQLAVFHFYGSITLRRGVHTDLLHSIQCPPLPFSLRYHVVLRPPFPLILFAPPHGTLTTTQDRALQLFLTSYKGIKYYFQTDLSTLVGNCLEFCFYPLSKQPPISFLDQTRQLFSQPKDVSSSRDYFTCGQCSGTVKLSLSKYVKATEKLGTTSRSNWTNRSYCFTKKNWAHCV